MPSRKRRPIRRVRKFRPEIITNEYKTWRRKVYVRDKFKCVLCNSKSRLNAHHLDGWSWCIPGRYDKNNGVTLCYMCHEKFHAIYGKGKNTRGQFEMFLSNRTSKTLNQILKIK